MATEKKTPKHDTWMPLYVSDYLADTMLLSTEQHGAYMLLLMAAWKNGGWLPDDGEQLMQITRLQPKQWLRHEPILRGFFSVADGRWLHGRVQAELDKAKGKVAQKAEAGTSGAAAKWGLDYMPPIEGEGHSMTRSRRLAKARSIGTHTQEEWAALIEVCGQECVRCHTTDQPGPVKDHIQPIYQGGSDSIHNLQPVCRRCNSSKGAEAVDYRPSDWLERLTKRLAERLSERLTNA